MCDGWLTCVDVEGDSNVMIVSDIGKINSVLKVLNEGRGLNRSRLKLRGERTGDWSGPSPSGVCLSVCERAERRPWLRLTH